MSAAVPGSPLNALNVPFWARLAAKGTDPQLGTVYAWQEVSRTPAGFGLPAGAPARFGTATVNPAIDPNGAALAPTAAAPLFVRLQRAYFDPGGRDWVYLICDAGAGGKATGLDVLLCNGVSATSPKVWDATVVTPPDQSIALAPANPPVNVWLFIPSGLALTAGDYYEGFLSNTLTALPYVAQGQPTKPAESRPRYIGWGGWVSGGGQCNSQGTGILLTTY